MRGGKESTVAWQTEPSACLHHVLVLINTCILSLSIQGNSNHLRFSLLNIPRPFAMSISVNSPADFHVHLRQGAISELITPHVRKGGFGLAYVMVGCFLLYKLNFTKLRPTKAQFKTTYHNNRTSLKVQDRTRKDRSKC